MAHFLKIYSNLLKGISRLVKKFYMSVIGKIILCTDLQIARTLIKNSLIVSMNETEGVFGDKNAETSCNIAKQYLINSITGQSPIDDVLDKLEEGNKEFRNETEECQNMEDDNSEESINNNWSSRADSIVDEIETEIVEGLLPNAHYCQAFAEHLISDILLIPMWSCMYRSSFGYGRIPASSAAVEGEFNKLKNVNFDIELWALRVDKFLQEHIDVINGKSLIGEARFVNKEDKLSASVESMDEDLELPSTSNSLLVDESVVNHPIEKEDRQAEKITFQTKCPACINGDEPSGSHMCSMRH